jgi:hypothetical protein
MLLRLCRSRQFPERASFGSSERTACSAATRRTLRLSRSCSVSASHGSWSRTHLTELNWIRSGAIGLG